MANDYYEVTYAFEPGTKARGEEVAFELTAVESAFELLPTLDLLTNAVSYSMEWAVKAEDSLVSTGAGGDGSTQYSSLHYSIKSSDSAIAAASSASSASTSASTATTQASSASSSATAAAASETAAAASETNAASSESTVSSAASAAATSETNAATSETNAATSETNAATSETNAAASETAAAASETAAAASETSAANDAASVAALYDLFDDRYLGAKASDPTLDNDGNTLIVGARYWNTTSDEELTWDGAAWQSSSASHVHSNLATLQSIEEAYTTAEQSKLAGIAASANNYSHPNHSGQVTSTGDGATALTVSAIIAQPLLASQVSGTTEIIISHGGVLNRTNISALLPYLQNTFYTESEIDAAAYSHPNHSGEITSTGDGATVLTASAITNRTAGTTVDSGDFILYYDTSLGALRKLNTNSLISAQGLALTSGLAGSDEILVSDDGVLKRMDISVFNAYFNSALSFNNYSHPNHSGQITSTGDGATALTASAITAQTALTSGLAGTDEIIVSDDGVLKRMDISVFNAYFNSALSFNNYSHPNHSGQITSTGDGATALTASAITAQTALTSGLAGTDEILVSDGGVLKRTGISVVYDYVKSLLGTFTSVVTVANTNTTETLSLIGGMTTTLGVGLYKVDALLRLTATVVTEGTDVRANFSGNQGTPGMYMTLRANGVSSSSDFTEINSSPFSNTVHISHTGLTTATNYSSVDLVISGVIETIEIGTFQLQFAKGGSSSGTCTVQTGSWLTITPVS